MFKEYYRILGIPVHATSEEVKQAFKNQAIRWHPDRNPNVDTTRQMQEINEAYLILKDAEARARYDIEYQRFTHFRTQQQQQEEKAKARQAEDQQTNQRQNTTTDYKVADDMLKKWMDNAQKQAVALAQQTIRDMKSVAAAATSGCVSGIIQLVFVTVVLNVIFLLFKSCN